MTRVHAWHPYPREYGLDAGVGEDPVEQGGELRVQITDQILDLDSCLVQIHHEIPSGLDHPDRGGMRGGAEDSDPAVACSITARMYGSDAPIFVNPFARPVL